MDFRKTFDLIPERFDQYRPRYCPELFQELTNACRLAPDKRVLEIGPGTGQATEPVLQTGCEYTAVELGENFTSLMKEKYRSYPNFHILNADFETVPLKENHYDLIYSAATIQWIPEGIAFPKIFRLLRPGGYLAMFMTRSDEKTANPLLKDEIDQAYAQYFRVKQHYTCRMQYENALHYGFACVSCHEWKKVRRLNAEEYLCYISTHCEHITLEEPFRSRFYDAIRQAILNAGDEIVIQDTIPLYLYQKPV